LYKKLGVAIHGKPLIFLLKIFCLFKVFG